MGIYGGVAFDYSFKHNSKTTFLGDSCPEGCDFRGHGKCLPDGSCRCNNGFTGEDCTAYIMCDDDKEKNYHSDMLCVHHPGSTKIITVSPAVRDTQGNGAVGNPRHRVHGGSVGKPYQSLKAAVAYADTVSSNVLILVYPSLYSG